MISGLFLMSAVIFISQLFIFCSLSPDRFLLKKSQDQDHDFKYQVIFYHFWSHFFIFYFRRALFTIRIKKKSGNQPHSHLHFTP